MNYNEINRHPRDKEIHFDSSSHTYTHEGNVFRSVTTVVESCFEQFNVDYWAQKKAPSMGITPEELKAQWERKGELARNLGTQMHERIERYYLALSQASLGATGTEGTHDLKDDATYALFRQFTQYYHLSPFRTEWAIFDEESHTAGTLDFLHRDADGTFVLYDWKRSNKIIVGGQPETASRWGRHALKPIEHIPDTTYWHYALQLSIYRYILEKNYGIATRAGRLAIFHPDNGTPYVAEVPYLKKEVTAVLYGSR